MVNLKPPWARIRKDPFDDLIETPATIEGVVNNKKLSKLGDALMNFIYSLSISISRGVADGSKIPNLILAKAIVGCEHSDVIPRRSDKHKKGDVVEAIFAYAWLKGEIKIRESIMFLANRMGDHFDEDEYAQALGELIDRILDNLEIPENV